MSNKLLKKLDKAYIKRVNILNKNFTKEPDTGLLIFVEQLRYIRDTLIVKATMTDANAELVDGLEDKASALIIATAEFEAYKTSKEKEQKEFHWNNFCEFIKLNLEEWLVINDTIQKSNNS